MVTRLLAPSSPAYQQREDPLLDPKKNPNKAYSLARFQLQIPIHN